MTTSPVLTAIELIDLDYLGWENVAPALRCALPDNRQTTGLGILLMRSKAEGGPTDEELFAMWSAKPGRPLSSLILDQAKALRDAPIPKGAGVPIAEAIKHRAAMLADRFLDLTHAIRDASPGALSKTQGFLTWDGLMAQRPPEWLVPGLVPVGGVGSIIGQSQSLKTFFLIHLGLSLATGRKPLGEDSDRSAPTQFALIVGEGASGIMGRMRAWAQRYDTERPSILMQNAPANLGEKSEVDALIERLRDAREPGMRLVVGIDTLSANFVGDENGPEVAQFVRNAIRISRELAAPVQHPDGLAIEDPTVLFVHHLGKDATKGARGHSSLHANVDFELTLRRSDAGSRIMTRVTCTKQKDGATDFDASVEMHREYIDLGDSGHLDVLVCGDVTEPVVKSASVSGSSSGLSNEDWVHGLIDDYRQDNGVRSRVPDLVVFLSMIEDMNLSERTLKRYIESYPTARGNVRIEKVAAEKNCSYIVPG